MRFCKYCGAKVEDTAAICPACGKEIRNGSQTKESGPPVSSLRTSVNKIVGGSRRWIYIGAGAAGILLLIVLVLFSGKCRSSGCRNRKAPGSNFCYNHKCDVPDCRKERLASSNYCYEHYLKYDLEDEDTSSGAYSWELKISDVKVYSEYSFTFAEGSLTNNSSSTVKYVKLKGSFKSRLGTVIDTDWTYAVGSEGLAPGETCKWKMSVAKDYDITDCDVTILDND
jgi:hypothetical protein